MEIDFFFCLFLFCFLFFQFLAKLLSSNTPLSLTIVQQSWQLYCDFPAIITQLRDRSARWHCGNISNEKGRIQPAQYRKVISIMARKLSENEWCKSQIIPGTELEVSETFESQSSKQHWFKDVQTCK